MTAAHGNAPLSVGIVGCGKIADAHVEQIARLPGLARVVAACDHEPAMAEQLAYRYGIPAWYGDLDAMLARQQLDVVHVATPPVFHLPVARAAVDAGCHVYVEKPLAPTFAECVELCEHVRSAHKKLCVGYTYLFDPPALALRRLLEAGVVGDPVHVETSYGYDLDGSFGAAVMADRRHWVHRLPGRLMHNVLDHVFNKLVGVIDGAEPRTWAFGQTLRAGRYGDERDLVVDELRVLLRGERVTGYATVSSHARPHAHRCKVYGTRATVEADFVARTVVVDGGPRLPTAVGRVLYPFDQAVEHARQGARNVLRFAHSDFHFFAGLCSLLERFYLHVRDGAEAPISDRDMLWVAALVEQVVAQLPQGVPS